MFRDHDCPINDNSTFHLFGAAFLCHRLLSVPHFAPCYWSLQALSWMPLSLSRISAIVSTCCVHDISSAIIFTASVSFLGTINASYLITARKLRLKIHSYRTNWKINNSRNWYVFFPHITYYSSNYSSLLFEQPSVFLFLLFIFSLIVKNYFHRVIRVTTYYSHSFRDRLQRVFALHDVKNATRTISPYWEFTTLQHFCARDISFT